MRYTSGGEVKLLVGRTDSESVKKALSSVPGVNSCSVSAEGDKVAVSVAISKENDIRPELARLVLTRNWDLYEMETRKNSLEDVFRTLTSGGNEK